METIKTTNENGIGTIIEAGTLGEKGVLLKTTTIFKDTVVAGASHQAVASVAVTTDVIEGVTIDDIKDTFGVIVEKTKAKTKK